MPFPSGTFMRIVLGGNVSAQDVWNIGIWYQLTSGTPSQAQLDSAIADIYGFFLNDFWGSTSNAWKALCDTTTSLSLINAYVYSGGNLIVESKATSAAVAGTSSSGSSPSYTAAVFTLKTPGFGRSARGRIYLPYTSPTLAGTHQMGVNQSHADHMATFLARASFASAAVTGISQVLSLTHATNLPITNVSVDTKPDTQRGRQNKATATNKFSHTVP